MAKPTNILPPTFIQFKRDFLLRVEFGDPILLVYFIAIARQWFWVIDNWLAWTITIPVAVGFWCFYVLRKESAVDRTHLSFWLIVGLPLFAAYLLRAPFPDTSFDVWGLRLFHGERSLHGFLYLPGEFFPTAAPFNPTPDMVTGIFRHLLGYRLGTIINLFALLWTGTILNQLLRPVVTNERLRALFVLLVLFAEHLLFEINNYMPDLLGLPVLLEATRITLEQRRVDRRSVLRVAFLCSLAVTLKLSNGAVALPLVLIWVWRCVRLRPLRVKQLAVTTLLSILIFIAPLLPFTVWVYKLTGSPIFPLYNGIFRSPFYPLLNGWDNRWGGYGPIEILEWPVLMYFKPERAAELPVYSGRLSVGFIIAVLCLALGRRLDQRLRTVSFVLVGGSLLWSLTMGYIRYGLYLEVLSGLLLIYVFAGLLQESGEQRTVWRGAARVAIFCLLIAQSTLAGFYLSQREWSMRPTAFNDFDGFRQESHYFLRDYSLRSFLSAKDRELFDRVEVWVVSGSKTSGPMILLNNRPVFVGVRAAGLFLAAPTRTALDNTLDNLRGKEMWSLALEPDYTESLFALRSVGLNVKQIEVVSIPFFSAERRVRAYFFKVIREEDRRPAPSRTSSESMLPAEGYRATISTLGVPRVLLSGEQLTLFIQLQNSSSTNWPSAAAGDGKYQIKLRARWLAASDKKQVGDAVEIPLPYDFTPGEATLLPLDIKAPIVFGEYLLEMDLIQNGVSFSEQGSTPEQLRISVER